ncbi:MAG: Panacea domain-containing protein [Methanobrevibacter wolinii]|nr:Panacea domain-containing protein [Methanobrevibacter wolinii]
MNENLKYNSEKFKSMIHYIISRCEMKNNLGRVVLYKLLYFSDFNYYELYEEPISGETYIKKTMGPVPNHFSNAINELKKEGKISEKQEKVIDYSKYKYSSLTEPDVNHLSSNELQVIDDTINKLSNLLSKQISEYSHGDMPWKIAENEEPINYEAVFYRDPEYSVREYDD